MFFRGLLATLPFFIVADSITLQKNAEITCVVPGNEEPIYLNPPVDAEFTKASSKIGKLKNCNWLNHDEDPSAYDFVLDKRWEDFKILKTPKPRFAIALTNAAKPLSVYLEEPLILKVTNMSQNQNNSNTDLVKSVPTNMWFHIMMSSQNNTIHLLSKDKVVNDSKKINFDGPFWVYIESNAFYKSHEPSYKYSNDAPNGQEEGYIEVLFSDNLCLSMYVSVDIGCTLQIALKSNNATKIVNVTGFNRAGDLKTWKQIKIIADSPGTARLSFATLGHGKSCYRAIDDTIEYCRQKPGIYHTNVTREHRCEMLNQSNASSDIVFLENRPGYLGNVSCAEALGSSYPYCEKHKICISGFECFCSWGYEGPSCQKTCEEGHYGLSCSKKCRHCTRCHPSTGACFDSIQKIHVKYVCESKWCHNETVKEESYNIYSPKHIPLLNRSFDEMVPFTKYKPVVTTIYNNEPYEKSYSSIEVQPQLGTIKDSNIYNANETTLWIKFKPPQNSSKKTNSYGLWYQVNSSENPPNYVEVSQCDFWKDFLCAIISNLKSNTPYDVVVMKKNLKNGKTKFSAKILLKENETALGVITDGKTSRPSSFPNEVNAPTTIATTTSIVPLPGTTTRDTIPLVVEILVVILIFAISLFCLYLIFIYFCKKYESIPTDPPPGDNNQVEESTVRFNADTEY